MGEYRFEPLSDSTRAIWLETANKCSYAPMNVLDETYLDIQSQRGGCAGSVIVYDAQTARAVALFPGEIATWSKGPFSLRILRCRFGGILVVDDEFQRCRDLRQFVYARLIRSYYRDTLNIDLIEIDVPPQFIIENAGRVHEIVPLYHSFTELNSVLYLTYGEELLPRFSYNVRREILKGLEHLGRCKMLRNTDDAAPKYFRQLDAVKASALKIDPLPLEYFESIVRNRLYRSFLAVADDQAWAGVIYSYCKGVASFHYNASTDEGKKQFVNKALLYLAMQECYELGGKYFLLGMGHERGDASSNVDGVNFFKRRFSTHEATYYRFTQPLSYKGYLMAFARQMRANRHRFSAARQ